MFDVDWLLSEDSSSNTRDSPVEDKRYCVGFSVSSTHLMALASYILSKDAYMLIYVRSSTPPLKGETLKETRPVNGTVKADPDAADALQLPLAEPVPPPRAAEVIETLNVAHEKACEEYNTKFVLFRHSATLDSPQFSQREKEAEIRFNDVRRRIIDIYQSWNISSNAQVRNP